jgi:hypothetical protein
MDFSGIMAPENWGGYADTLSGLFAGGAQTGIDQSANRQVQSSLGQNAGSLNTQIQGLQDQIAQNRQQAQDMYQRSLGDVTSQNQGLQGNIGTMTTNLNALSDPNSPYMQMARQAIERKDAAAGRNSQWGDRETQLAGTLADYVGKYSPGIQNSISNARNQISQNNQGLASLYSQANNPSDRNTLALIQALQAQQSLAAQQNGIGRTSASTSNYDRNNMIQTAIRAGGGLLGSLFGNGGTPASMSNYYGDQASQSQGITGYGNGIGNTYGANGAGSIYDNQQYGYGSLPAADYFGGGGFGGTPMGSGILDQGLWGSGDNG